MPARRDAVHPPRLPRPFVAAALTGLLRLLPQKTCDRLCVLRGRRQRTWQRRRWRAPGARCNLLPACTRLSGSSAPAGARVYAPAPRLPAGGVGAGTARPAAVKIPAGDGPPPTGTVGSVLSSHARPPTRPLKLSLQHPEGHSAVLPRTRHSSTATRTAPQEHGARSGRSEAPRPGPAAGCGAANAPHARDRPAMVTVRP